MSENQVSPVVSRELRLTNESKNLSLVRNVVKDFISNSRIPDRATNLLVLAIDEAIANVVEHAYGPYKGVLVVSLKLDEDKLEIVVSDNGEVFRPAIERPDPNIKQHIRLGLKGGLGMFMMKRVMDEVRYSTTSSYNNCLTMVKFLPDEAEAATN